MADAAQLLSQGPGVVGSHGPLSEEELKKATAELAVIKAKHGFVEPVRSHMEYKDIEWRFGKAPNYTLANLYYFKGKYKNHKEGSLELVVENLVKTWEMEASHKKNVKQWKTIDQTDAFVGFSANGWKNYGRDEMIEAGNYNVLMHGVDDKLWENGKYSWMQSHDIFKGAMPAFAWEVLEVYSGPPVVAFSWHHFGKFTGEYKGNKGTGQWANLFGFGTAQVNADLQFVNVQIFYNIATWLEVLEGKKKHEATETFTGCPLADAGKGFLGC